MSRPYVQKSKRAGPNREESFGSRCSGGILTACNAADITGSRAPRCFWESHCFAREPFSSPDTLPAALLAGSLGLPPPLFWFIFFFIHMENLQRCRPNPNDLCCKAPAEWQWRGACGLHRSEQFSLFSGSSALGSAISLLTGKSDFMRDRAPSDPVEKRYHEEKKH